MLRCCGCETGTFGFTDMLNKRLDGNQKLLCELTIKDGQIVYDLNGISADLWTAPPGPHAGGGFPMDCRRSRAQGRQKSNVKGGSATPNWSCFHCFPGSRIQICMTKNREGTKHPNFLLIAVLGGAAAVIVLLGVILLVGGLGTKLLPNLHHDPEPTSYLLPPVLDSVMS